MFPSDSYFISTRGGTVTSPYFGPPHTFHHASTKYHVFHSAPFKSLAVAPVQLQVGRGDELSGRPRGRGATAGATFKKLAVGRGELWGRRGAGQAGEPRSKS